MSARTAIRMDTVVCRSDEPVAVEVDGRVVMMSVEQAMYFALEGVAPRIWALLEEPRRVSELCAVLTQEFEIDDESCRREVLVFLEELRSAQLIRIRDESDAASPSSDPS